MSSLQKTFVVVVPLLFLVGSPLVRAQSSSRPAPANGTKITVDGTSYSVTPLGNFLRVDDLDGHMIGMARKDGSVIAPQSGSGFDTVKAVALAYLHPGKGAPQPEPNASSEISASAIPSSRPSSETAANDRFVFPATGGAILKGTPFGDITYSADGTEARALQKTTSPIVGETTIELIARYRGGDDPAKGKAAGVVKGGAKVLFESMNPRAKGNVNTRGNDEIVVSQSTNGGKESAILGTGEKHVAESQFTPRDLNAGNKQRGDGFLRAAYAGLKDAMDEAAKRRAAGQSVSFDPAATVAGQNTLKEYARYEATLAK